MDGIKSDYMKYRGRCKEYCERAIRLFPQLRIVRGHYFDVTGPEQHWWCERPDGTIFDPTKKQFQSQHGEYEEFNGWLHCENCGEPLHEKDIVECGNYPVCSTKCQFELVGISEFYRGE